MEKLVRENISLNEGRITKSYETPMTRDDIRNMIVKLLIKYKKHDQLITNMSNWLSLNNFGNYQHNRWIKAIVDTLFKHSGGVWVPKNHNLSIDELTDIVMNFWSKMSRLHSPFQSCRLSHR